MYRQVFLDKPDFLPVIRTKIREQIPPDRVTQNFRTRSLCMAAGEPGLWRRVRESLLLLAQVAPSASIFKIE